MFGLIVSGRMVSTNFEQVGQNGFMAEIQNAEDINHLVVFMTGQSLFPAGLGALIFFSWPSPGEDPKWQLLGYITNEKPSAVFKISGLKKKPEAQQAFHQFCSPQQVYSPIARIGISLETITMIEQQVTIMDAAKPDTPQQIADFSQKMLESFLNYAGSFAITQSQMLPNPNENYIPLSVVRNWYDNFLRKLAYNPNFWKT